MPSQVFLVILVDLTSARLKVEGGRICAANYTMLPNLTGATGG